MDPPDGIHLLSPSPAVATPPHRRPQARRGATLSFHSVCRCPALFPLASLASPPRTLVRPREHDNAVCHRLAPLSFTMRPPLLSPPHPLPCSPCYNKQCGAATVYSHSTESARQSHAIASLSPALVFTFVRDALRHPRLPSPSPIPVRLRCTCTPPPYSPPPNQAPPPSRHHYHPSSQLAAALVRDTSGRRIEDDMWRLP